MASFPAPDMNGAATQPTGDGSKSVSTSSKDNNNDAYLHSIVR